LERFAKLSTQTRDFRYLSVTMGTRTLGTPVSDDEITAYYNNNSEQFAEEESLIIEYVLLDKSAISAELQTDVAELRQQYELERLEFEGSSEKRASHILFEVGSTNSEDVAIELAADTKSRIDAGEEFSDLAMELSIDAVSAEEGGDIGFTDGTAFPVEIEEALNLLELNEVFFACRF
ncbi:MAG: peptidylprolyl isomerase, partial [Pseudohongiellaceae bacterium]